MRYYYFHFTIKKKCYSTKKIILSLNLKLKSIMEEIELLSK